MSGPIACAVVAVLLWATANPANADAMADRRALVMLRILAYDKQLGRRVGDDVRVVIAYASDDDGERARWAAAFEKARKLKVDGRTVTVVLYAFDTAQGLDRALHRSAAVLVCDGLSQKISPTAVAKLTRTRKVLSITNRESEVAGGLAVGIVGGKSRDEIVINMHAVEAEGAKFDAGLLQLARTVKEP